MSAATRADSLPSLARAVTERHARTFALACGLLPAEVREDVYLLYLVFRTLDDLVDGDDPRAARRVDAVARWAEGDLQAASPEVGVLSVLADRHELPREPFADFCAGMRQDLAGERFQTEHELDRYCYRVAGTVGVVMASILGVRAPRDAAACAAALGMAMQRTNILRDVDEDLAAGRIYLAAETVERCGGSLAPGDRAAILRDGIARAEALYADGMAGIGLLHQGRFAIHLAAVTYREILHELARTGLADAPRRVSVSSRRKLWLLARTALAG